MTAYEVLQVPQSATADQIRRAWRKLALRFHPDRLGGDLEAMKLVNQAYDILTKRRVAYDAVLSRKREDVIVVYAYSAGEFTKDFTQYYTVSPGWRTTDTAN